MEYKHLIICKKYVFREFLTASVVADAGFSNRCRLLSKILSGTGQHYRFSTFIIHVIKHILRENVSPLYHLKNSLPVDIDMTPLEQELKYRISWVYFVQVKYSEKLNF